jgi:hypothetical protein
MQGRGAKHTAGGRERKASAGAGGKGGGRAPKVKSCFLSECEEVCETGHKFCLKHKRNVDDCRTDFKNLKKLPDFNVILKDPAKIQAVVDEKVSSNPDIGTESAGHHRTVPLEVTRILHHMTAQSSIMDERRRRRMNKTEYVLKCGRRWDWDAARCDQEWNLHFKDPRTPRDDDGPKGDTFRLAVPWKDEVSAARGTLETKSRESSSKVMRDVSPERMKEYLEDTARGHIDFDEGLFGRLGGSAFCNFSGNVLSARAASRSGGRALDDIGDEPEIKKELENSTPKKARVDLASALNNASTMTEKGLKDTKKSLEAAMSKARAVRSAAAVSESEDARFIAVLDARLDLGNWALGKMSTGQIDKEQHVEETVKTRKTELLSKLKFSPVTNPELLLSSFLIKQLLDALQNVESEEQLKLAVNDFADVRDAWTELGDSIATAANDLKWSFQTRAREVTKTAKQNSAKQSLEQKAAAGSAALEDCAAIHS